MSHDTNNTYSWERLADMLGGVGSAPVQRIGGNITITAEQIADSQRAQGAFQQALRVEWMRYVYHTGSWNAAALDPDLEMDIGL